MSAPKPMADSYCSSTGYISLTLQSGSRVSSLEGTVRKSHARIVSNKHRSSFPLLRQSVFSSFRCPLSLSLLGTRIELNTTPQNPRLQIAVRFSTSSDPYKAPTITTRVFQIFPHPMLWQGVLLMIKNDQY